MTVGFRRPPAKPSDLSKLPPVYGAPPWLGPFRKYVEELGLRLDLLWTHVVDSYRATQNPSGLPASAQPGGIGGSVAEDAEILALIALKKGDC